MTAISVTSLSNLDDLRAYVIDPEEDDGKVIETTGYYMPNDGGGGSYYYKVTGTGSDNAGTIIKPNSVAEEGRWFLISDTINIRQFGAQCDEIDYGAATLSKAANTARVQAAVSYCAKEKFDLFVPAGTYSVTAIDFNPEKEDGGGGRYKIFGQGAASRSDLSRCSQSLTGSIFKAIHRDVSELHTAPFNATLYTYVDGGETKYKYCNALVVRDLTLIGETADIITIEDGTTTRTPVPVFDARGAFKSEFKNLTIQNLHQDGSGFNVSDMDQLWVENVQVINKDPEAIGQMSSGEGIRIVSEVIDGSASIFTNVQVAGFDKGFVFGKQNFLAEWTFQRYNTFTGCGTDNCNVGLYMGRKWAINRFVSCAFRALNTGAQLGVTSQNVFTSCVFESTDNGSTGYGLDLGFSDTSNNRQSTQNTFQGCLFKTHSSSAAPVNWFVRQGTTMGNVFTDCEFLGVTPAEGESSAINVVTGGAPGSTGTVIRPRFNTTKLYSTNPQYFSLQPRDNAWKIKGSETNENGAHLAIAPFSR